MFIVYSSGNMDQFWNLLLTTLVVSVINISPLRTLPITTSPNDEWRYETVYDLIEDKEIDIGDQTETIVDLAVGLIKFFSSFVYLFVLFNTCMFVTFLFLF